MNSHSIDNRRIAKNTLFLYIRLFFTMAVGLFTSRVILQTLGIDDYGVYNVVAGVVSMFTLFTNSLSSAISRFLTFHLGKGDNHKLSVVFSTSVIIMVAMAVVVVVLMELIGVWFLNAHLNIPDERLYAANWVFQFSIITFAVNLISAPYNAVIVANEHMNIFAYISILEVILKLVIVYLLYISPIDKLITYAFLIMCISIVIRFVYGLYCSHHFKECKYHFVYDKGLLREMGGFAGWNFLGSGAYLFNTQGVNIVSNIYFGVAVNAARGVVNQVEGIVKQFVTNFTTAINPQITKSYASDDLEYTYSLVCRSSKFCFLLMLFFLVPFIFEAEFIMHLWLNNYPPEAPIFLRLSLIGTIIDLLGNSPAIAAWATGNIKRYYLYVASVGCLVFPISWILFSIGFPAYISYLAFIFVYIIVLGIKLKIIRDLISFPVVMYYKEVIVKIFLTVLFSFIIPTILYYTLARSFVSSLAIIIVSLLSVAISSFFFGLTKGEKDVILNELINKVKQTI